MPKEFFTIICQTSFSAICYQQLQFPKELIMHIARFGLSWGTAIIVFLSYACVKILA